MKYQVIKSIAQACLHNNVPQLDERLKSIVASMVGNLLRVGYQEREITPVAVNLALEYNRHDGHEAMLRLQGVVELRDEDRAVKEHKERRRTERAEGISPSVAAILDPTAYSMGERMRRHPNHHSFQSDGVRDFPSCTACGGPPGVHVQFVEIPELEREVMNRFEFERSSRRKMRAIGEPEQP